MAKVTDTAVYETHPLSYRLAQLLRGRTTALLLLILSLSTLLSIAKPEFLTRTNLTTVAMGMTYDLLMACGMTLVLIAGGIDLSVGAVLGLTGIVTTLLLQSGWSIPLAVAGGLVVAVLCGAANGIGVARLKLPPFIVTLGVMSVTRGIATVLTSGYFVSRLPESYLQIGQGTFLDIPYPVLFVIPTVLILDYLLRNWRPLKQLYYVGHNPEAARLSGVRVGWLQFATFVISAVLAGIAAIFMTSRLAMGFFQFGLGSELTAIAAAVIGGASLTGGHGNILGTFLGVTLLALINNGFVLLNGSPNWQNVVSGVILVMALVVDAYTRRRAVRE